MTSFRRYMPAGKSKLFHKRLHYCRKVLKTIPQNEFESDETIEGMHEVRLLSKLKHPGIVQLHDSFTDGEYFCIVTEYCEVCTIFQFWAMAPRLG